MNWEESKALTPLKREFLCRFFDGTTSFFLTGGSALGIFYLNHRLSYDLDLFSTTAVDWHQIDARVRSIADAIEADLLPQMASPTFRRYSMRRGQETETLDFVIDHLPQMDPEKNFFGTICVDTLHEIFVNKICTLVSRSEVKDLIDLYFLEAEGLAIEEHFSQARQKEGGLDPAMIAFLLDQMHVDSTPAYLLKPAPPETINAYIDELKKRLAALAFPES